jgi:hypothetical protein
MKIRNGLVSNSSTSSFCIYGTSFEKSELIQLAKEIINKTNNEELKKNLESEYNWSLINEIRNALKLSSYNFDYTFYIGREWVTIKDDETGGQFKESVKESFRKVVGDYVEKLHFSSIEEASSD